MAKLLSEVQGIINSTLSIQEKIQSLKSISTTSRPGKAEAESLSRQYLQKICDKRNALVRKHYTATAGFYKSGRGYDVDFVPTVSKCFSHDRWAVGISANKFYPGRNLPAASAVSMAKSEKFARHCKKLVPSHVFTAAMRLLGWPEEVAAVQRGQYRSDLIRVSGEIATFVQETGLHADFWGKKADVLTAQENGAINAYKSDVMYTKAADCCFVVRQEEETSWGSSRTSLTRRIETK